MALTILPLVVGLILVARNGWYPASDWALIEIRTRDVGSDTPLVGVFSRFGWNHPGPLLFWVLAVPYRLTGGASESLLLGATIINAAALAGIQWLAHRHAGDAGLIVASLGASLFVFGAGPELITDPWNASLVVLPFALSVLLAWSVALGNRWVAPAWLLVSSFIVQSHVGYAPFIAVQAFWILLGIATDLRRGIPWSTFFRPGLACAAVGCIAWIGPAIEQATVEPGNVTQIATHFATNDAPSAGLGPTLDLYGRHLAPWGVWLGAAEPTDPFTGSLRPHSPMWALPLLGSLLAVGLGVSRRRLGSRPYWMMTGMVGCSLIAGLVAGARVTGSIDTFTGEVLTDTFPYLFHWLRVLAALAWILLGWGLLLLVGQRKVSPSERVLRMVVPVTVVLLGATGLVGSRDFGPPMPGVSDAIEEMTPSIVDAVDGRSAVMWGRGSCLFEAEFGVANQLDAAGVAVRVAAHEENRFGQHRVWNGSNAEVRVTVACQDEVDSAIADAARSDQVELIGFYDTLPVNGLERIADLRTSIESQLQALNRTDLLDYIDNNVILFEGEKAGVDQTTMEEYTTLVRLRDARYAVILEPPEGALLTYPPD